MEHYGDIHLHQADYPGCSDPSVCAGTTHNYYHGNQCSGAKGADHPYDCHCNLCQAPYSLPYQSGSGGHLGGLKAHKPCGFPHCKCTDCDGNCRCSAVARAMMNRGNVLGFDMKYIIIGVILGLLALMLLRRR